MLKKARKQIRARENVGDKKEKCLATPALQAYRFVGTATTFSKGPSFLSNQ